MNPYYALELACPNPKSQVHMGDSSQHRQEQAGTAPRLQNKTPSGT